MIVEILLFIAILLNVVYWTMLPSFKIGICIILVCGLIVGRYFTSKEKDPIGGYLVAMTISAIFCGIGAIVLEMCMWAYHTKPIRNIRYRGYIFPTHKNKIRHMERLINGELRQTPPDDFV